MGLRKPDTGEGALEMVADELPDGNRAELLRSIGGPGLKLGGDTHQRRLGLAEVGMQTGQCNRRLPGVFRSKESKGSGTHYSHHHNPSFPCPALCAADSSCSTRGLARGLASRLCPVMVSILA